MTNDNKFSRLSPLSQSEERAAVTDCGWPEVGQSLRRKPRVWPRTGLQPPSLVQNFL